MPGKKRKRKPVKGRLPKNAAKLADPMVRTAFTLVADWHILGQRTHQGPPLARIPRDQINRVSVEKYLTWLRGSFQWRLNDRRLGYDFGAMTVVIFNLLRRRLPCSPPDDIEVMAAYEYLKEHLWPKRSRKD